MRGQGSFLRLGIVLLLAVVVLGVAVFTVQAASGGSQDQAKQCCFTNEQFSGICSVYPTGDETCADILAYLNNPMSVGKNYCGNTRVRGGWRQVECK